MATSKKEIIEQRPLIQIDDEIREMTEEEHAFYLEQIANLPELPQAE